MTETLDTKLVTDWREVLPVVTPFYEKFFGEKMPCLDGVVSPFTEEDPNYKYANGSYTNSSPNRDIKVSLREKLATAETLFHELTHRCYDEETGFLALKLDKALAASTGANKDILEKKIKIYNFLEECVAYSSSYWFRKKYFHSIIAVDKTVLEEMKSEVLETIDITDLRTNKGKLFIVLMLYVDAKKVGNYLALKHFNDSDFWFKLKQLRTLDDLKKLVEEK